MLNEFFPVPVACISGSTTLDVDAVPPGDWPSLVPSLYLSISTDSGATWLPLAEFVSEVGQTVDAGFTLTPGFLLRFEEPYLFEDDGGVCNWGVWAQTEVVIPAGHHLEYTWSGDATNPSGARAELPDQEEGIQEFTATVVVDLVRDSDDEVICTATDTWIEELACPGIFAPPDYDEIDYGNNAEITEECEGTPVSLEVTLDPTSGCPGDTITATGSHNITSAELVQDGGNVPLTLTPSSGIEVDFEIPNIIEEAGTYSVIFETDADVDTVTDTVTFTVGSECFEEPPEPCEPPVPVACWADFNTIRVQGVAPEDFPECTETLTFELLVGESWTEKETGIVAEQEFTVTQTVGSGIKGRFKSDDDTTGDELTITEFCECEPPVDPDLNPPATPGPPTLVKSCADVKVTVTSPAFDTTEDYETETIEIRRRVIDGEWQTVHTFTEATTWDDETVAAATAYQYQARACNEAGCSEWGATATISLKSTTSVAIISPATGTLTGKKRLRMSHSGPATNPRLYWNGVLIGAPVWKEGFYLFDWNTLDSSQGTGILRFQVTGSDGCDNFAEVEYTLANPAAALTNHIDVVCREGVAPEGMRVKSASLRFQAEPPGASARQRYFLRTAAYLDDQGANDAFALEFDEDSWEAGQPLLLQQGRKQSDGTTQWTWFDLLAKKAGIGKRAIFRLRFDVGESLTGFSTFGAGSNARIVKFQSVGAHDDDDYRVLFLARKVNGSGARVYQFDGETIELLYDLADAPYSAPGAFDFALLGDKLFIAAGSELFYVDTDSGDASANLAPRGETRAIAHLAVMGSSIFALYNGDDDCNCYHFDGSSWKATWTLPVKVDKAYSTTVANSSYLMLASGPALYAASGTTTPTLAQSFGSDITALHERFVGLADGKLYEFIENQWHLRADRSGPVLATSAFAGVTHEIDDPRGVAGENSPTLLEATTDPSSWTDNRTLEAPPLMDETVASVTSLHRFLKQIAEAEGSPNMPGYVPARFQEVLLMGTAPDALLLLLETNVIARSPLAVEATQVGAVHAMTVFETLNDE